MIRSNSLPRGDRRRGREAEPVIRSPTPAVERMRQYRRRRRQRAAVQEEYGSVAGKRNCDTCAARVLTGDFD
jgi:hypothetical protein